jgi:hypothetical protein
MQNSTRRITDRDMPPAMQRQGNPISAPAGDYLVVGDTDPDRPGIGARIAYGLQIVLIIVLAVLSFAIFWVVGLLLNVF